MNMYFYVINNKCGISPIRKEGGFVRELSAEEYDHAMDEISSGSTLSFDADNNMVFIPMEPYVASELDRVFERQRLHEFTDSDFLKYSRNIRLNEDIVYSQQCCDYIDQYNDAVSKTVNQPNYPAEVTYPVYQLPTRT